MVLDNPIIDIGAARVAIGGGSEALCGDNFLIKYIGDTAFLILVDGLGHGEKAADIAASAITYIGNDLGKMDLNAILEKAVRHFQSSRGFVVFLCQLDIKEGTLNYSAIGNISCKLISGTNISTLIGARGIIGATSSRPLLKKTAIRAGGCLLLHSDGISSHLPKTHLLAALKGKAQDAAETVLESFGREYDDASVIVAKW